MPSKAKSGASKSKAAPSKTKTASSKPKAPKTRLEKAQKERMYFLRTLPETPTAFSFLLTGASGKVYTVTIPTTTSVTPNAAAAQAGYGGAAAPRLRCNCMDHIMRKTTCKHMLFIALRVLRLTTEELTTLETVRALPASRLTTAMAAVSAGHMDARYAASPALSAAFAARAGPLDGGPAVPARAVEPDDACPICCEDLTGPEALSHCAYGCGKPLHTACFERYADAHETRVRAGDLDDPVLRCVFCRAAWRPKAVGARGFLAGRRLVDLAESMPEAFEPGAVAAAARGRRAPARRPKAKAKGKGKKGKEGKVVSGKAGPSGKASSSGAGPSMRSKRAREELDDEVVEVAKAGSATSSRRRKEEDVDVADASVVCKEVDDDDLIEVSRNIVSTRSRRAKKEEDVEVTSVALDGDGEDEIMEVSRDVASVRGRRAKKEEDVEVVVVPESFTCRGRTRSSKRARK